MLYTLVFMFVTAGGTTFATGPVFHSFEACYAFGTQAQRAAQITDAQNTLYFACPADK